MKQNYSFIKPVKVAVRPRPHVSRYAFMFNNIWFFFKSLITDFGLIRKISTNVERGVDVNQVHFSGEFRQQGR